MSAEEDDMGKETVEKDYEQEMEQQAHRIEGSENEEQEVSMVTEQTEEVVKKEKKLKKEKQSKKSEKVIKEKTKINKSELTQKIKENGAVKVSAKVASKLKHKTKQFLEENLGDAVETEDATENKKKGFSIFRILRMGKLQRTLTGAFLLLVFLIMFLGIFSYQQASKAIMKKYESSAQSTVEAMSLYTLSVCNGIASKTLEIANNDNMKLYYGTYWKESASTSFQYYDAFKTALSTMKTTVSYVYNYYVIAENGNMPTSHSTAIPEDIYEKFITEGSGVEFAADKTLRGKWVGLHPVLDSEIGIRSTMYGISYIKTFVQGKGFIVVDVNYATVDQILEQLAWGEGSVSAIVTSDGRSSTPSKYESTFKEDPFQSQEIVQQYFAGELVLEEGQETHKYVDIEGETYLLVYSPVGETGMLLCSLIPKSLILAEMASIRNITIIIVLFSAIIAMVIGTILATGICREVIHISSSLEKVSAGNFTVNFKTKRKDEFKDLNNSLNFMLSSVRDLIGNLQGFGDNVIEASRNVSEGTDHILVSTKDINRAIEEVARGVVSQAQDTETSLDKMQVLSDRIGQVQDNTNQMNLVVNGAITAVNQGEEMVSELNEQSEATSEITKVLVHNIAEVQDQSNSIGSIIETINSIAQQTNLLSLNASIEAARAGEHGRGFSVVAQEIRKLADQSMESGKQIKTIVEAIQKTAQNTTKSAKETEQNMVSQADVLKKTTEVFKNINESVLQLVEGFKEIESDLRLSSEQKDQVMDSVRNIASVSEETAASAEEVTATTNQQMESIAVLTEEAEKLLREAENLEESMKRFIIK